MTTIANKTPRAIAVPLPRGKKLHLGPGKTGQIAANDSEHPPFKKLVEAVRSRSSTTAARPPRQARAARRCATSCPVTVPT